MLKALTRAILLLFLLLTINPLKAELSINYTLPLFADVDYPLYRIYAEEQALQVLSNRLAEILATRFDDYDERLKNNWQDFVVVLPSLFTPENVKLETTGSMLTINISVSIDNSEIVNKYLSYDPTFLQLLSKQRSTLNEILEVVSEQVSQIDLEYSELQTYSLNSDLESFYTEYLILNDLSEATFIKLPHETEDITEIEQAMSSEASKVDDENEEDYAVESIIPQAPPLFTEPFNGTFSQAVSLVEAEELVAAEELLQSLLESYEDVYRIYFYLGEISYLNKDYHQAISYYQEANKLRPNSFQILFSMANSHYNIEQVEKAIEFYEKLVSLYPDNDETYYNLGNAYYRKGNYSSALSNYEEAIRLGLRTHQVYFNLANTAVKTSDYSLAKSYYQESISLNPNNVPTLLNLANVLDKLGERESILYYLSLALELEPNNPKVNYNIANHYKEAGDYDEAIIYYIRTIQLNPTDDFAYSNLGDCYRLTENYKEALESYYEALHLNPDNPLTLNNLAITYILLEDFGKSIEYLRKAAALGHSTSLNNHLRNQ